MDEPHPTTPAPLRGDGRVLVVLPTYDEAASLERVVTAVLASPAAVDVLVVDDASPDGTGDIADRIAAREPRVTVLHRPPRSGLGSAYLAGFAIAAERGAEIVVEMDADGSHPVDSLPALVDAVRAGAGAAIGSRWIPGGSTVDWPAHRELLSRGANAYARIALGIPVRDATAGYRAFSVAALERAHLADVVSRGYCFQIDMTLRLLDSGAEVVERPIVFSERTEGRSKMSGEIVLEAMLRVTGWGLQRRLRFGGRRGPGRASRRRPA
jgi:dolichol-phosphate mannosyltransferase